MLWKKAYEINYVNGCRCRYNLSAVRCNSDVKIIKDGYFLYQVDRTKIQTDPTKPVNLEEPEVYGEVEYSNGELREYIQYGSGNYAFDTIVRSCTKKS